MLFLQVSLRYREETRLAELAPHIYGTAERMFRGLLGEARAQCCVISGESGAGKTESSKFLVQHLLSRASSEEANLNVKIQQVRGTGVIPGQGDTEVNGNSWVRKT